MAIIHVERRLDAPPAKVWAALADFGNVQAISPAIESSASLNDVDGLGAERSCEFGKGQGISERITAWQEGSTMTVEGIEFRKTPMKHMHAHFQVKPDGEGTLVSVEADIRMKGDPIMGWIAKPMMRKNFGQMLEGAGKP